MSGHGSAPGGLHESAVSVKICVLKIYSICENLVLWARSEIIGSALLDKAFLNPKHEIRKPKQYRRTKIRMIQTKDLPGIAM